MLSKNPVKLHANFAGDEVCSAPALGLAGRRTAGLANETVMECADSSALCPPRPAPAQPISERGRRATPEVRVARQVPRSQSGDKSPHSKAAGLSCLYGNLLTLEQKLAALDTWATVSARKLPFTGARALLPGGSRTCCGQECPRPGRRCWFSRRPAVGESLDVVWNPLGLRSGPLHDHDVKATAVG